MTPEVRRAAVRMAAKAALVAGAVGCSGGTKTAQPSNTEHAAQPAACPAYLDGLAVYKNNEIPDGDPLKGKPGVYGAFKDVAARSAPRTKECCAAEVNNEHGASSKHRWECCSALGEAADMSACTPWGPPCPPEMFA